MDITVDRNNKHVIVATLQGGTIYTIDRKNDGSLGEVIAEFTYEGKEPGKVSTIHHQNGRKELYFPSPHTYTPSGYLGALLRDGAHPMFWIKTEPSE